MFKKLSSIEYLKLFRYFIIASLVIIIAGTAVNVLLGANMSEEFLPKTIVEFSYKGTFNKTFDLKKVEKFICDEMKISAKVMDADGFKDGEGVLTVIITGKNTIKKGEIAGLSEILEEKYKDNELKPAEYEDEEAKIVKHKEIAAQDTSDLLLKGGYCIIIAAFFLFVYAGFKYKKISGAKAGILAAFTVIHNSLVTYFVFVIARVQIGNLAFAAMTLGFFISALSFIILFERIRENKRLHSGKTKAKFRELVLPACSETISRMAVTAAGIILATIATAVSALVFGIPALTCFAFAAVIAVITNLYGASFITAPLFVLWVEKKEKGKK